jgi:hypothetical protein
MQNLYLYRERPMVLVDFVVDDFGDEFIACPYELEGLNSFQAFINNDTFWHLRAFAKKVLGWGLDNREE